MLDEAGTQVLSTGHRAVAWFGAIGHAKRMQRGNQPIHGHPRSREAGRTDLEREGRRNLVTRPLTLRIVAVDQGTGRRKRVVLAAVNWSDLASFAVAGGTLVLAWITRRAVVEARRASEAARSEGQAALNIAREAHRDRELVWRPVLTWEVTNVTAAGSAAWAETVVVKNVGSGPAIACEYISCNDDRWAYRRGFALRAGEIVELSIEASEPPWETAPKGLFDPVSGARRTGHRPNRMRVLICSDILGRRWRFFEDFPPESVAGDEPNPPPWATPPT